MKLVWSFHQWQFLSVSYTCNLYANNAVKSPYDISVMTLAGIHDYAEYLMTYAAEYERLRAWSTTDVDWLSETEHKAMLESVMQELRDNDLYYMNNWRYYEWTFISEIS